MPTTSGDISLGADEVREFFEVGWIIRRALFSLDEVARMRACFDELERMANELPWLTYIPTISRPWDDPSWAGETGRVDDIIRKYTDLWSLDNETTTAYLCGHPDMIENGKGILRRRGWKKEALREEVYFIIKHAHAE